MPDSAQLPGLFFQGSVLNAFAGMKRGRLRLELPDGRSRRVNSARPKLAAGEDRPGRPATRAFIRVRRATAFFTKSALYGDIGFAESFIDGD